jgi:S-(hydroxymethyl)glutathione dehydrogenase / alcohol dehydrogenase
VRRSKDAGVKVRVAVLDEVSKPLVITEVDVLDPGPNEVMVRLGATGVCHTDLSIAKGAFPVPVPCVLGHEGAGVVERVGSDVTRCRVGDTVVLSLIPQCGECLWCTKGQPELCGPGSQAARSGVQSDGTPRFRRGDSVVYQLNGLGTFAEVLVADQSAVVPISSGIPIDIAALLGCAVLTGVGAALNTADIAKGDTVAVIGCGGVGLNVIQGARIAGAERIIALDPAPAKLDLATKFGATDTIAVQGDSTQEVLELTGGIGVDVVFDVVGGNPTAQVALQVVRRGGQVCIIGMSSADTVVPVAATIDLLVNEKRLFGSKYGSSDVRRDIPRLLAYYDSGVLLLDELISRRIGLEDINGALDEMASGLLARSVVVYS